MCTRRNRGVYSMKNATVKRKEATATCRVPVIAARLAVLPLRDQQRTDLGAAAESHPSHIADPACHVNLPRSPGFQSGDVSFVGNGRIARSIRRNDHLSSMSVSTEHQVPGIRSEPVLRIGVMRQQDDAFFTVHPAECLASV